MNLKRLQKRILRMLNHNKSFIIIGVILIGITTILMHKRPMHAASDRAKTAAGVIFGAGVGGGIAGGIGGAKWLPLGFGVGGLAGGLLVRAIRKNRERRNDMEAPVNYTNQPPRRYNGRYRRRYPMSQGIYQPMQQAAPVMDSPEPYNGSNY